MPDFFESDREAEYADFLYDRWLDFRFDEEPTEADLRRAGLDPEHALGKHDKPAPDGATKAHRGKQYKRNTTEYGKEGASGPF